MAEPQNPIAVSGNVMFYSKPVPLTKDAHAKFGSIRACGRYRK